MLSTLKPLPKIEAGWTAAGVGALRIPSAKRWASPLSGLHSWYPYYAGYSPQFVQQALSELGLGESAIILDPMNGSGTTTTVAQEVGHFAIGFDLNPAMAWIAGAKDASAAHWTGADDALIDLLRDPPARGAVPEVAKTWMSEIAYHRLGSLLSAASSPIEELEWESPLRDIVAGIALTSGRQGFMPACAILSVRTLGIPSQRSNPTWVGPPVRRKRVLQKIDEAIIQRAKAMKQDLDSTFFPQSKRRLIVGLADARQLPLPDGCIDAVVSSPPYLTRLDYAISTAPELALLGTDGRSRYDQLRRKLVGSTVTRGFEAADEGLECRSVVTLLEKISKHDSKASAGYYRCFFENYFRDAQRLMREIARVLKSRGAAILVVQDSWYKDIHIALGDLFLDIAAAVGLDGRVARSELVKQTLTRINVQASAYKKGNVHEHTLLFRRRS